MRAMRWTGALGMAVALTVAGGGAAAQQAELAVSGGLVTDARGGESSGVGVSPALYWSGAGGELLTRGEVTLLRGGEAVLAGSVGAAVPAGRVDLRGGSLGLELGGSGRIAGTRGWRRAGGRFSPRLVARGTGWRAAAGPDAGVETERLAGSEPGALLERLGGGGGAAAERTRRYHGISAEARLGDERGSVSGGWSGYRSEGARWQELSVGISAGVAGAVLGAAGGVRVGEAAGGWGGLSAAIPMGRAAALVAEGGLFPSDPLLGREGGRYATIGMRVRSH